ncbi:MULTISPECIES: hypothetical protein [Hyphomonas]|uniref:hypothetical protein n=1 Tax=Hyphomonas TaxID=85 RepID=UPI0002E28C84|nr:MULTISPECIES: hypothetical protein [Hyphomonas]
MPDRIDAAGEVFTGIRRGGLVGSWRRAAIAATAISGSTIPGRCTAATAAAAG